MGIDETNGVDFAVFQMNGSMKRWCRDYMLTTLVGSPSLTWHRFSKLFLEIFLYVTLREDYHILYEHLHQGSMTLTQ